MEKKLQKKSLTKRKINKECVKKMGRKYCSKCGKKVPRTYKTRNGKVKKTNKKRKYCFNCSPIQTKHKQDHPQIRFSKNNTEKRRRKQILVDMLGGKCENCGYKKSLRALSFHHVNPPQKKF